MEQQRVRPPDRDHAAHDMSAEPAQPVRRSPATMVVGRADDPAEHEADGFADRVVATLGRRDPVSLGAVPVSGDGGRIRRAATGSDVLGGTAVDADAQCEIRAASGGQSLPEPIRRSAEAESGRDLGGVRLHTGASADRLSRSLHAAAFTSGSDIFVRGGQYRPGTAQGDRLLAHEVGHVVQQGGGAVARRRIDRDATLTPLDATSSSTIRRKDGEGTTQRYERRTPDRRPARDRPVTPQVRQRLGETDAWANVHQPAQPYQMPQSPQQVRPTGRQRSNGQGAQAQPQPTAPERPAADNPGKVLEDMEQQVTEVEELYSLIRETPAQWGTLAAEVIEAVELGLTTWPPTSKLPEVASMRRRLRNVGAECQALVDRAGMPNTKQRAGDVYMRDGAKDHGEGTMQVLDQTVRDRYFKGDDSVSDPRAAQRRQRIQAAGRALGLSPAEQTAITVFTTKEYKYINPATDNNKSWMLGNRNEDAALADLLLDEPEKQQRHDEYVKPRLQEGSMHATFALAGLNKLPVWTGPTYRGEAFTAVEFGKKFDEGKVRKNGPSRGVMTPKERSTTRKAISSTSKDLEVAEGFGVTTALDKGRKDAYIVIWEYQLIDGRDIEMLSDAEGEAEVATLPGATFSIDEVVQYDTSRPLIANQRQINFDNIFLVKCQQIK